MVSKDHLSDEQLLRAIDGEMSAVEERDALPHLESCGRCRARRQELENASRHFALSSQSGVRIPNADAARTLFLARLEQVSNNVEPAARPKIAYWLAAAAAVVIVAAVSFSSLRSHGAATLVYNLPDASLTPGAAVPIDRAMLCSQGSAGNKVVPVSLRQRVFEEYRIAGADPHAYEVDYLITPALGGADDIRNLWPQAYSAPVWNARVKDALEDRLRDMVCGGGIELADAQREIATNWIAAYKKYFHTEQPLAPDGKDRE
jgi:anti-sigma factor RsiW